MSKKVLKKILLYVGAFLTLGVVVVDKLIKLPFWPMLILLFLGMGMVIFAADFIKED